MAYQLLDPREEEELFKSRLLNVEEKPFKRITKRLATLNRVVAAAGVQEQTPPPETEGDNVADDNKDAKVKERADTLAEIAQLREDVTLDFAAFDASIARLQFLAKANTRERQRYADHRVTIDNKCREVRDDALVSLRSQLDSARATLKQRQAFDALADRITSAKTLWPRPEQQAAIDKLEDECRQLQRESEAYTATWRERKQQFARIMDESMRLRRLIRDEKEEVERREGMDDEEAPANAGASQTANASSAAAGDKTPLSVAGATLNVTAPTNEGNSPAPTEDDEGRTLRPGTAGMSVSREVTPVPSIAVETPAPTHNGEDGDDIDMVEVEVDEADARATAAQDDGATPSTVAVTPAVGTPHIVTDGGDETPAETEKMDTT
ncbi:hypothetical protein SEUCBS139899_003825 [Sporothrix eucalyptigena]|uniref:Tho complex subunit 7 n=1 Tax=Sporothrix eucalyptigena TaxID=1812306 RepID=A0ABP0BE40_9PEZI